MVTRSGSGIPLGTGPGHTLGPLEGPIFFRAGSDRFRAIPANVGADLSEAGSRGPQRGPLLFHEGASSGPPVWRLADIRVVIPRESRRITIGSR
jgi:hypothetical protein